MKTNAVPAVVMLTAGLIECILSIRAGVSLFVFTKRLLVVLLIFYVLGCVIQLVLDKYFKDEEEEADSEQKGEDAEADSETAEEGADVEVDPEAGMEPDTEEEETDFDHSEDE